MFIYFLVWNLLFPNSVWRVIEAEFVVYIFTYLDIHVSTDDLSVVFPDAMNKRG